MYINKKYQELYLNYATTGQWRGSKSFKFWTFIETIKIAMVSVALFLFFIKGHYHISFLLICCFSFYMYNKRFFFFWNFFGFIPFFFLQIFNTNMNLTLVALVLFIFIFIVSMAIWNYNLHNKFKEDALEATKFKTCPHCAETILREANVCRFCTRDLI